MFLGMCCVALLSAFSHGALRCGQRLLWHSLLADALGAHGEKRTSTLRSTHNFLSYVRHTSDVLNMKSKVSRETLQPEAPDAHGSSTGELHNLVARVRESAAYVSSGSECVTIDHSGASCTVAALRYSKEGKSHLLTNASHACRGAEGSCIDHRRRARTPHLCSRL